MTLFDHFFSPSMQQLMAVPAAHTHIDNVGMNLIEMMVAGLYSFHKDRPLLWIVGENENPDEKKEKLELWFNLFKIPEPDINILFYTLPFEDPYVANETIAQATANKAKLISHILGKKRAIIITTLSALNIRIENRETLTLFFYELKKNQSINREELIEALGTMGYRNRNLVEEPGDISWRGSIVDVFPLDSEYPVRIEIEADTLVSLRQFDPDTQKSVKQIDNLSFSVSRFFFHYENCSSYFNGSREGMVYLTELLEEHITVVSDIKKVYDEFHKLMTNYHKIYEIAIEKEAGKEIEIVPPSGLFALNLEREPLFSINETWDTIESEVEWMPFKKYLMDLNLHDIGLINEKLEKEKYRLFIFAPRRMDGTFPQFPESFKQFEHIETRIPYSIENPQTRSVFLADREYQFFERVERVPQIKADNLVDEIQVGDTVVHQKHGIGKFVGFKSLSFERHVTEFLKIEYFNNEFLYVPVYELDVLKKYVAFEGQSAKLDKLGGNTWELKKKKAQKSIVSFARELLELYAMRKAIKGNAFPKEYELEEKLEAGFQYVETEDQKRAIRDVMADLEKEYPMDRLLCGDVSFGKTEVALRAALRVVANGKQVAVLCPTTILAYQHFKTFSHRLTPFPVSVAMLSRMVSPQKRKAISQSLAEGKIDIVIGTHSLIYKNLSFKRLGLYVIDEEQRFGVFQKETLKKNREEIDVLSMSATPIPRTLSFAMAGLQDISVIRTPPIGRMAIKNYVGYFTKEMVVSAVLSEIERNGSVFVVYNDIDLIYSFRDEFQKWLPNIPATVIHAKMNSEEIETNLMKFIDRQYRVLISTTIIENGIDIPDVNTLIVLDSDKFGLTQLYQLRGRIGRGNRQAYAYFLVKSMSFTDKARKRLEAIREFSELGAGYKLAEFDLKLRGAGSLLGNKQHGHIEALGFEYYHQLLVKTIKEMKGEFETRKEAQIHIHFSYSIDSDYIKNTSERISLYRRILEAEDLKLLHDLRMELEDRYGKLPAGIDKIFYAGTVRVLSGKWNLEEVDVFLEKVVMKFINPSDAQFLFDGGVQSRQVAEGVRVEFVDEKTRAFYFTYYKRFTQYIDSL